MSPSFDHLIHWVNDVDAAKAAYDAAGLPTHDALTMPGFRNAAWGIDDERYVELATVTDWDAVAESKYSQGVEILRPVVEERGGQGPLTFAVEVSDARATAAELRGRGHDVTELEVWFEERNAGFVEVFVRDAPTYFPFFITYTPPRAEIARMRAEHRAKTGATFDGLPDLVALVVHARDPLEEASQLGVLVGVMAVGAVVPLEGAEVRFEQGERPGLRGIVVSGGNPHDAPAEIASMNVWRAG